MTEDIIFHPPYKIFLKRMDYSYLYGCFIGLVFTNIAIIFVFLFRNISFFVFLLNIIPILYLIYYLFSYKYYLKYLIIHRKEKTIEFCLFSFNKQKKIGTVNIAKVEVKTQKIQEMKGSVYYLKIYYNKNCIITQQETNEWTKEMFEEIKNQIDILKK